MNERIATQAERLELVSYFENLPYGDGLQWLRQAARRFADCDLKYPMDWAKAIIEHPTMQDTPYNRANGYTPYTTPSELYRRILRASS
jgi:hypothetical protein